MLLVAAVILSGPTIAAIAFVRWGQRLKKRGAPQKIARSAYVVAAIIGLVTLSSCASSVITAFAFGAAPKPTEKARVLAEVISEAMNSGAFALLLAAVGGVVIAIWSRQSAK